MAPTETVVVEFCHDSANRCWPESLNPWCWLEFALTTIGYHRRNSFLALTGCDPWLWKWPMTLVCLVALTLVCLVTLDSHNGKWPLTINDSRLWKWSLTRKMTHDSGNDPRLWCWLSVTLDPHDGKWPLTLLNDSWLWKWPYSSDSWRRQWSDEFSQSSSTPLHGSITLWPWLRAMTVDSCWLH